MNNDYLNFYGQNNISPVHQDISDFNVHLKRRQKLYRQCGIPTIAFRNADVLEVGPGGGHNALATLSWGISHIDLIEPNPKGVETITGLFRERGIEEKRYTIVQSGIEDYRTKKKYDIVIAEGFLAYVSNVREICNLLMSYVKCGGVIVVTCADDTCIFIELIKRLIGRVIAKEGKTLSEKVEILKPVFEPQLKRLIGVSRPVEDWIEDNIFNPTFANGNQFSMMDAIDFFEAYDLLGCSPKMFTDYSWYKDIWFNEKDEYKKQFEQKRLSLIMAGMPEQSVTPKDSRILVEAFSNIKGLENEYERTENSKLLLDILDQLNEIGDLVDKVMDKGFVLTFNEIIDALTVLSSGDVPDFKYYPSLFSAFGRGLQYVSFMKTGNI